MKRLPIRSKVRSSKRANSEDLSREERMRRKLKEYEKQGRGGIFFGQSDIEDEAHLRILPPFKKGGDWYYEAPRHWSIGPSDEPVAVTCPKETWGEPCPICNLVQELFSAGDLRSQGIAKELMAKPHLYANVYIHGRGFRVFTFSKSIHQQLLELFTTWGDIDRPNDGFDIIIKRTGKHRRTKYNVIGLPNKKPIHSDEEKQEEILSQRVILRQFVEGNRMDFEDIQDLLDATDMDELAKKADEWKSIRNKNEKSKRSRRIEDD